MRIFSLQISFKGLLVLYVITAIVFLLVRKIKSKKQQYYTLGYCLFYIFYYMLLVNVVVLPITILYGASSKQIASVVGTSWNNIQLIPFSSIVSESTYTWGRIQIIGNFILLMPFVAQLLLVSKRKKGEIGILTLFLSVAIELQQFLNNYLTKYPSHAIDIDDIILNVLGGICVIVLYIIMEHCFPNSIKKLKIFCKVENSMAINQVEI